MTEDESDKLYMSDPRAKSLGACIEALEIFAKYFDRDKRFSLDAQHDVLHGPDKPEEDSEDGKRLLAFGWHWDEEGESWAYFT